MHIGCFAINRSITDSLKKLINMEHYMVLSLFFVCGSVFFSFFCFANQCIFYIVGWYFFLFIFSVFLFFGEDELYILLSYLGLIRICL